MSCTETCIRPTPAQAHCAAVCHQTFGGVTGFDRHRRDGMCIEPTSFGYVKTERGIWVKPMDSDALSRLPVEPLAAERG